MKRPSSGLYRRELLYTFHHHGGFSYGAPVFHDGDTAQEPLRSKLILFEDGNPLRRGHEHHDIIAGTGRGAYCHWERYLFFSTSDNTDPNKNGRSYSIAIDRSGEHQPIEDGRTLLNAPFYHQQGQCWGAVVADDGDDAETETLSTLRLYEDGRLLGPSHTIHTLIEQHGRGRYSHWKRYLYFSSSDGSDPNTNGRLYTYMLDDAVQHRPRDDGRTPLKAPFAFLSGRCWGVDVAVDGNDVEKNTLSTLRLYEDERPLGPAHAMHAEIEQHGAGRYSHWGRRLYFSTSDDSDPNANGRLYTFALAPAATGQEVWSQPRADGRMSLNAPFLHQNGLCWRVAVAHDGDVLADYRRSTMRLYEDDRPLGPRNCMHIDIERSGAGSYSHWKQHLYFSTSDGSDPNTNGRCYTYNFDG